MGLDMFAYSTTKKPVKSVDFNVPRESCEEVFYWRKHPNLHGWMQDLYFQKGGKDESFNCACLKLTMKDLNFLEKIITKKELPFTEGMFFGSADNSNEEMRNDLKFIKKAKSEILKGKIVFYTAWW